MAGARPPVRIEGVIGAETEILGGLAVGLTARYEKTDDELVRVVDPATGRLWVVNGGDPLPFSELDGRAIAVPDLGRTTRAVEAYARKRLGDGWQAELSLMWGRSEGRLTAGRGPDLERLEGPVASEPFSVGDLEAPRAPIPGERPWQARALGSYTFDGGTVVGATAWWASGAPQERLGASSADLRLDQRPVGAGGVTGRTPSIWEVDLRIAHPVDLGAGELELAVEILNLFDRQATLRGDPRWSLLDEEGAAGLDPQRQRTEGGWGRALVRQPPRRVELGLRYRW